MKKTRLSNAEKSSADILLEAIQDMYAKEQVVTRESLKDYAGLADMTKTQIDDRLAYLENNGRIVRLQRGVFVPAHTHKPSRQVFLTVCPDGTHVLEVGDDHKLILTPREARNMGQLMSGAGQQFVAIELGHEAVQLNNALSMQVRDLRRQVARLSSLTGVEPSLSGEGGVDA